MEKIKVILLGKEVEMMGVKVIDENGNVTNCIKYLGLLQSRQATRYHLRGQHQFWNGRDRMDVKRFRKYTNVQRDEILGKAGLTEREEAVFLKMKRNESATIDFCCYGFALQ